jgi:hypothetical protein
MAVHGIFFWSSYAAHGEKNAENFSAPCAPRGENEPRRLRYRSAAARAVRRMNASRRGITTV